MLPKTSTNRPTYKIVIASILAISITGCQQIPHADKTTQLSTLSNTTNTKYYAAGQYKCLKYSSYHRPQVSGKIIDTPTYMLITMMNQDDTIDHKNNPKPSKGELCIVNKALGVVQITAIDRLRFLEGIQ